jgi:5-oxoprolinase (ATP-hydrolysing)
MPPFSTTIQDEGVQINNVKLVAEGVLQEQTMLDFVGQRPVSQPQPPTKHGGLARTTGGQ